MQVKRSCQLDIKERLKSQFRTLTVQNFGNGVSSRLLVFCVYICAQSKHNEPQQCELQPGGVLSADT